MMSFFKKIFIYFERAPERVGEGQKEKERERKSQAGPMPSVEPDAGLSLMTLRSRPELIIKSRVLNRLSHPCVPRMMSFKALLLQVWSIGPSST